MPAYVVIQLAAGSRARALIARPDFKRLVAEYAAQVIEATAGDDPLVPLTLTVRDMARADALAAALRGLEGVETAYAKPGEALP
jgi:pyrimidine operon attenuation protein/uracil phosphoribosyltransferase